MNISQPKLRSEKFDDNDDDDDDEDDDDDDDDNNNNNNKLQIPLAPQNLYFHRHENRGYFFREVTPCVFICKYQHFKTDLSQNRQFRILVI